VIIFGVGTNVVARNWVRWIKRGLARSQSLIPGAIAAALSVGMWQIGLWQPLERLGYNTLFQAREAGILPPLRWDQRVVVIAIDDASLNKYGNFPWSRDRYAHLLQALSKSPPAAIGFDILFVDPGQGDGEFAQALRSSSNVVLATAWDKEGHPLEPLPSLKTAAKVGQIWHNPDPDGISRQAALFFGKTPSLGLAMLQLSTPEAMPLPQLSAGRRQEDIWVNWPGNTKRAQTYSFVDVVEGKVPRNALVGQYVLVGVTGTAVDPMRSPLNQNPPTDGVYLHAAVIDNLLNDRLLRTPSAAGVVLLLLLLGPATSLLLSNRGVGARIAIALSLPHVWLLCVLLSFSSNHRWLPIAAPIGTIILAGIGVQLREQYEKQQLMNLFAKHVSPETAQVIWQHKDDIFEDGELQAQEMTATVLFSDIRGFTSISEKLPPRELLSWLNEYLDAMTDCIMDHGGVIDKYIGDAIMAVFGIPFAHTQPEAIQQDALNAIAAGIAMQKRLQALNQRLEAKGKPTIQIGIGIHTGLVVAGSVGGSRRLNYSVLGDTVNVAARLESMNKEIKTHNPYNLIITGKTFAYVSDRYQAHQVGATQLRGREQASMIYCIQGEKSGSQLPADDLSNPLDLSA